jgi:hypothetical protein
MTAARANRLHAQQVELAMELEASLADEQWLDHGADREVGRVARYAGAVREWIVARVPPTSRVMSFLDGISDGLRGYRAVDALRDRENRKQIAIARELAGVLDRLDLVDSPVTSSQSLRAAVGGDSTAAPAAVPTNAVPA